MVEKPASTSHKVPNSSNQRLVPSQLMRVNRSTRETKHSAAMARCRPEGGEEWVLVRLSFAECMVTSAAIVPRSMRGARSRNKLGAHTGAASHRNQQRHLASIAEVAVARDRASVCPACDRFPAAICVELAQVERPHR